MKRPTLFERHAKLTLFVCTLLGLLLLMVLLEGAGRFLGLGRPVLYNAHPVYGYRPQPNQTCTRHDHTVHTNNLALRANSDWDLQQTENKVLFLGDSVTYGGSYVSNDALFSHLAVAPFSSYEAGNAGVNAWGVDNVRALVVDMGFQPAQIYVSTFPEGDFYRGLSRLGGQPFWTISPRFALEELAYYWLYKLYDRKTPAHYFYQLPEKARCDIANLAVQHLKEMDDVLKNKGYSHFIFISPTRQQTLKGAAYDSCLKKLFAQHGLNVIYINDKLPQLNEHERDQWFYDDIHLSTQGHAVWADVISNELSQVITQRQKQHANYLSQISAQ